MNCQVGQILERQPVDYPASCFAADGANLKAEFSYLDTVKACRITYWSDGLRITGFLIKPKAPGDHPCVIFNRGGNRAFSSISEHGLVTFLCLMASWGYVVVASQYRGHGPNEGKDEFGGQDLNDVLNLIPLLEAEPGADASRIGMYGGSRGGMMTYLALSRTDRIRAAVVRCGLSDLRTMKDRVDLNGVKDMQEICQDLIPGFGSGDESVLVARSAVCWADRLCKHTPILLMHGTADWRVDPVSTLRLAEALLKVCHPFRLVMLEGSDHSLTEHIPEKNRITREWFDRFVRDRAPLPDMEPHGD